MTVRSDVFILSLRQQVIFPAIRTSISIHPQTFTKLCQFCERHNSRDVGVVAVNTGTGQEELYTVGTYCRIASQARSIAKVGGKDVNVVTLSIDGRSRFQVQSFTQTAGFRVATIKTLEEHDDATDDAELQALMQTVQQMVGELTKDTSLRAPGSAAGSSLRSLLGSDKGVRWPSSASVLADMITAGLSQLSIAERQQVLETVSVKRRLRLVIDLVRKVAEVQALSKEISSKTRKRTENEMRETVLRRQLSELQREMRKLKGSRSGEARGTEGGELGEGGDELDEDEDEDDVSALRESLKGAQLNADAKKIARKELRRLQNIQPTHPEYTVCRTYLETLASLPWAHSSKDDLDLGVASAILEEDHYGLEKVKRRILEFLAVQKMRGDMKGPILCLHGPPGVGKTSLGRSIAKALGRKFHRIALGGVRDEAELRGHRRTYIGSMPGAVMQAMMSLKVNNPVILLDEIDKLTQNAMSNPSGAMLELLDPEQNHTFKDHYVNTPFDLSKVLFLCTCNDLQHIDRPLLDRMEVIELSGYTVEEKVHIAAAHLLPKQLRLHALERGSVPELVASSEERGEQLAEDAIASKELDDRVSQSQQEPLLSLSKAALADLISKWTMESGVRSLERRIAQICRWAALRLAGAEEAPAFHIVRGEELQESEAVVALAECGPTSAGRLYVDARHLPHIIGAEIFEPDLAERLTVGVSMGLGVTPTGGHLLFVEATRSNGSGRLTVTGQLGEVMRESVSTAMSLLRSKIYYAMLAANGETHPIVRVGPGSAAVPADIGNAEVFQELFSHTDASKNPFGNDDIHVHFPAGAIPKDGPSAGVAITLALASLLLGRPVRSDTAVTGEITLRGHVLPVGGIRDKVLAAHRAGVRHVLLPFGNQRHAKDDIPASAVGDIELHFVKHIDDALAWAFAENVKPLAPLAAAPRAAPVAPDYAWSSKL